MSWLDRLRGGFSKTADKLADNLTGLASRAALDTATLDDIEEALIASDIGPEASQRIRDAIAAQKFERLDERGLRTILAEEIEKILAPVAKPLQVWGLPRPHVILVIGVNGSGKTTTIGKLGHWLKEQDYGILLCAGDTSAPPPLSNCKSGDSGSAPRSLPARKAQTRRAWCSTGSAKRLPRASTCWSSTPPGGCRTRAI